MDGKGAWLRDRAARQRYWSRSMLGYPLMRDAQPSPAHLALAVLEAAGYVAQRGDGAGWRADVDADDLAAFVVPARAWAFARTRDSAPARRENNPQQLDVHRLVEKAEDLRLVDQFDHQFRIRCLCPTTASICGLICLTFLSIAAKMRLLRHLNASRADCVRAAEVLEKCLRR